MSPWFTQLENSVHSPSQGREVEMDQCMDLTAFLAYSKHVIDVSFYDPNLLIWFYKEENKALKFLSGPKVRSKIKT